VAHYTLFISAYAPPRSDPFQTRMSVGKTCTVKMANLLGSIGCVPSMFPSRASSQAYILTLISKKAVPMTCLLVIAASLNTLFLLTHTKLYHLFLPACAFHHSANKPALTHDSAARVACTHPCGVCSSPSGSSYSASLHPPHQAAAHIRVTRTQPAPTLTGWVFHGFGLRVTTPIRPPRFPS
jgi:hypothetical protein